MARTKLILYTEEHETQLTQLLLAFSGEVWGKQQADVNSFVNGHWAIYLAMLNDEVIGFSSYFINHYFGLRAPTLGNTYIYVKPEHRSSRAMYLFSLQSGKIAVENGLNLEHYYSSEDSLKLSAKLKGSKVYETWEYDIGEVEKTFNKMKNKVRIK